MHPEIERNLLHHLLLNIVILQATAKSKYRFLALSQALTLWDPPSVCPVITVVVGMKYLPHFNYVYLRYCSSWAIFYLVHIFCKSLHLSYDNWLYFSCEDHCILFSSLIQVHQKILLFFPFHPHHQRTRTGRMLYASLTLCAPFPTKQTFDWGNFQITD